MVKSRYTSGSNLHGFLDEINGELTVPDKKFLRDGFVGLVRAGSPIVCRMAREVPNQRSRYTKRLDLHLTAESDFDERIKESLPAIWLPIMTDDTPLILDLSDLADYMLLEVNFGITCPRSATQAPAAITLSNDDM